MVLVRSKNEYVSRLNNCTSQKLNFSSINNAKFMNDKRKHFQQFLKPKTKFYSSKIPSTGLYGNKNDKF